MWAIIKDDTALEFDSLMDLDISDESSVVDGPIEKGKFASYNKFESALRIRIALGFNGNDAAFNEHWTELKELKASLNLVGVVAGQNYYENMSIETLRWSRQADVGFYTVDLTLIEIREVETQTTTTEYTRPKTKSVNSTGTVDEGKKEVDTRSALAKGTDATTQVLEALFGGGWK